MILVLWLGHAYESQATHIRAGEITARRIQNGQGLTYEITIIGYTDTGSTVPFANGTLDFGDGSDPITLSEEARLVEQRLIADEVRINKYVIEHTFRSPGLYYTISYREANRNDGVVNIENGNSVNTPFYIETTILIDPLLGINNTPQLLVPPIDEGAVGARFEHNPGAFDIDGDSISFRLTIPKKDRDVFVDFYLDPNDPSFGGTQQNGNTPTLFSLNELTGDMIWNAPGMEGEYNVAFVIEEWRQVGGLWFNLSSITRDMQIIISDSENNPPELLLPRDTCVEAGTLLEAIIRADDPDGHNVFIEGFGGPFEQFSSPATFTFVGDDQPPIAEGDFAWQTNCTHVRRAPYQVIFKATDVPPPNVGPQLVDFQTWNVTVVAPAPVLNSATATPQREISLDWEPYSFCISEAISMQIWRRVGSFDFDPDNCLVGIPPNSGYELIDVVDISQTSYLDDNNGRGLDFGANYCYRLVAIFPEPEGGVSYASNEVCALIDADGPVITNVSVLETSEDAGEVLVRWTPPYDVDPLVVPPPYTYEVLRADGFSGNAQLQSISARISDTSIVDAGGINTLSGIQNYRIILYDGNDNVVDTSAVASTVELDANTSVQSITLNWFAQVPWSNIVQRYPYHYIYRDNILPGNPEQLVLIDSVLVTVNGLRYEDRGQVNGEQLSVDNLYCYYVTTQGSYDNDTLPEPLMNDSQILCAQPNDTVPPCEPLGFTISNLRSCEEFLASAPCSFNSYVNELRWDFPTDPVCSEEVLTYNIYYSEEGEEGPYFLLASNVAGNFYQDANLASFARCYRIAAVDRSGNESSLSEPICRDNCPYYELPNVFTPQQDEFNEVLRAFDNTNPEKCARFVRSVQFRVYNRWGNLVYEYTSGPERDIYINWDGKTNDGNVVSSGVYFYIADVTFDVLREEDRTQQIKGWIHVLK